MHQFRAEVAEIFFVAHLANIVMEITDLEVAQCTVELTVMTVDFKSIAPASFVSAQTLRGFSRYMLQTNLIFMQASQRTWGTRDLFRLGPANGNINGTPMWNIRLATGASIRSYIGLGDFRYDLTEDFKYVSWHRSHRPRSIGLCRYLVSY